MMRVVLQMSRQHLPLIVGIAALVLVVFWVFKIRTVQRLRSEILQVETKLSKGQEIWRNSPPLSPGEREELQKAQERLWRMLPKEKDVPSVLQEVSRVAQDYSLTNLSLTTVEAAAPSTAAPPPAPGAPPAVVVKPAPAASPAVAGRPGPIDFFSIKLAFAGDYREIASFLEGLQKVPQLMTIQSLLLQRALPLVTGEVVLNAYYLKGDLAVKIK